MRLNRVLIDAERLKRLHVVDSSRDLGGGLAIHFRLELIDGSEPLPAEAADDETAIGAILWTDDLGAVTVDTIHRELVSHPSSPSFASVERPRRAA